MACFVSKLSRSKKGFDLTKMSLEKPRKLLGQKCALQGCHAVLRREVHDLLEIKDEDEKAILYRDLRPVKQSRRE